MGKQSRKRNLRRINIVVTAQTVGSLAYLAKMCNYPEIGMAVDKLTREKMLSLRAWGSGSRRAKRGDHDG
ncbi:MAG TPA: hypothetical protein IAC25_02370 [Candidatus Enterenecus stercoripullorum]|nr:hypothetical protein [Candidatus Enterenecus stercoripullorum]